MADHPEASRLAEFRAGLLPHEEMRRISEHLVHCSRCVETLGADTGPARRALRGVVMAGAHLSYEQFESYIEDRADGPLRERIEGHLAWCVQCRRECDDLAQHAEALRKPLARRKPTGGRLDWLLRPGSLLPQLALAAVVAAVALTLLIPDRREERSVQAISAPPGGADLSKRFDDGALEQLAQVSPAAVEAYRDGDFARLARVLTTPAEHGQPAAAAALGLLYARGLGVPRDSAAAERYWRSAAAAGDAGAAHNLQILKQPDR